MVSTKIDCKWLVIAAAGAALIILLTLLLPWPLMIFLIPVSFYSSLLLPSHASLLNAHHRPKPTIFN